MSIGLRGAGGAFDTNNATWMHLLRLAEMGGWTPAGTKFNREMGHLRGASDTLAGAALEKALDEWADEWRGGYRSNDYQIVTADDAANLAAALERMLPDVPDHNAMAHKCEDGTVTPEVYTTINPFEWLSGRKHRVRELIAFCRAGEFYIT